MDFHDILNPLDEYNSRLRDRVHPENHRNPEPADRYNLVVIGAGTAGLVTAAAAAGLGARVALVERALMGGDCLNVGCVPSKAVLGAAHRAHQVGKAGAFGISVRNVDVDFARVMERMRRLRSGISTHDSVRRFTDLGVDVFLGNARFVSRTAVEVDGKRLIFSKAALCTGARAAVPNLPGLKDIPYLTNETLFSLTERPRRFGVIGAGPIGAEMAQAFARLGAEVTLVASSRGLLPREDREAAAVVRHSMESDGVRIVAGSREMVLSKTRDGIRLLHDHPETGFDRVVDQLLVAAGRAPNVEGLDLETAGVDYSDRGIRINDRFQTTNPRIYAAGDVCSPYQFTHAADFMARAVVRNALFHGRARHSRLVIPWATYTSPELARVGRTGEEASRQGLQVDTFTQPFSGVDRALLEETAEGFVRIHVRKGTDTIVGATIVGAHAGDLIGEVSLAMSQKIGLGALADAIHPYPTRGEAVRKVGDLYNRTRLTPRVASWFRRWLAWTR